MDKKKIIICGTGAWGTALGHTLSKAGHKVIMAGRNPDKLEHYRETCQHPALGCDVQLDENMIWSSDIAMLLPAADIVFLSIPTQNIGAFLAQYEGLIAPKTHIVQTAKGIEIESGLLVDALTKKYLPDNPITLLSGPGFAKDVAQNKPTAVTVASGDILNAEFIQSLFTYSHLRPYASSDVRGVALGGALKNVLAIAAGFVAGYGLGESAKAALITRGFSEIVRFSDFFEDTQKETFFGLSGLGDIILTCGSDASRNFRFGTEIAQNLLLKNEQLTDPSYTAEGYHTLKAMMPLMKGKEKDFPILNSLSLLLTKQSDFATILESLLSRPLKWEGI